MVFLAVLMLLLMPDTPFPLGANVHLALIPSSKCSLLVISEADTKPAGKKGGKQARPISSVSELPLSKQLCTVQCIGLTAWFACGLLTLQFYLANVEYELQIIEPEDKSLARRYEELFSFMVPFILSLSP